MNLQIINGCAGTDPRLPTAGTNPGRCYLKCAFILRDSQRNKNLLMSVLPLLGNQTLRQSAITKFTSTDR